jgi:hypothetical protein
VSTAGYVKLLLPPRQSRGNSHWGLALTITGHATAVGVGVGADGKALVIRTREIGTIALPMDDARISSIRTSLAELLSMLTSIRKN